MKSMVNLDLEGRHIKLYPGDSIKKWGVITFSSTEGLLIKITKVNQGSWASSDGYKVGTEHFLPWNKLTFRFETTPE